MSWAREGPEKEKVMRSVILGLCAIALLLCVVPAYADDATCAMTCKDATNQSVAMADRDACWEECTTFCVELDQVADCQWKGEQILTNIPTVSQWGLVVMGLLVLTAGTTVVLRRRSATA